MLTHKIRDMPQNMFGGTAQSPSSDSGQSFASHVAPKESAASYMGDQSPSPINYHTDLRPHQINYPENVPSPDKEYHQRLFGLSVPYAGIEMPPSELKRSSSHLDGMVHPQAPSTRKS